MIRASNKFAVPVVRVMRLTCVAILLFVPTNSLATTLAGDWFGVIRLSAGPTALVFHLRGPDNALSATVDNPSKYEFGTPAIVVSTDSDFLQLGIDRWNGRYTGAVAGNHISGSYRQGTQTVPLVLFRFEFGNDCSLSQAKLVRLAVAETYENVPQYYFYTRGLVFDEGNCVREAAASFQGAVAAFGLPSNPDDRENLTESRAMIQLEKARLLAAAGQTTNALAILKNLVSTIRTPNAQPRAIQLLATLMPPTDRTGWDDLEGYIQEIGDTIPESTRLFLLARHDFQIDREAAMRSVEEKIEKTKDRQHQFMLQILLAEFYFESGRIPDAELLLKAIEEDAADNLLDWKLRQRFLEISCEVWNSRAAADEQAAERAEACQQILSDFNLRFGRYN